MSPTPLSAVPDEASVDLPTERFLSRAELAVIMGVSERTIDRWVKQKMPSELWGKRTRRFLLNDCVRWARMQGQRRAA